MIDILLGAIIFAIWSVVLFYGKRVGLSMLLFAVPLTLFIVKVLEKRHDDLNKKAKILILPITLLASTYFIFENFLFNTLNLAVIPILIAIMILALYKEKFEIEFRCLWNIIKVLAAPLAHIGETFSNLKNSFRISKGEKNFERSQKIKKVLKAIFITLPIVLVIIILLSAADSDFAKIFEKILIAIFDFFADLSLSKIIEIIILLVVAFIYLICLFNYISLWKKTSNKEKEKIKKDSFTIKMILGALNVIYLIFCYLQIKSLIINHTNINYSYYARQGFFQLMIVSLINLITLLIAKNREDKEDKKGTRYIQIMAFAMIVFTAIILISAVARINAYESAYGYTVLRLLVYCALFTEVVLLIPTILYILDKNINLAKTYFAIILTIYIGMNFMNFDRIIAKRNVDRFLENGKIDMEYIQNNLGTGAVGQVARLLDTNTIEKQDAIQFFRNVYRVLETEKTDFRDINISKLIAKNKIKKLV